MSPSAAPRSTSAVPRGRPRRGSLRPDRRNAGLDRSAIRLQLARELPELPRELAARADVLTLTFLAAQLLGRQEHDPEHDTERDDDVPQATR